jgi:hypothetical protein
MNKNDIIAELQNNICTVTFTKVSGEQRVMKCTLRDEIVPVSTTTTARKRTIADDVVAAYDVENDGWRSFKVDSVTSFTVS